MPPLPEKQRIRCVVTSPYIMEYLFRKDILLFWSWCQYNWRACIHFPFRFGRFIEQTGKMSCKILSYLLVYLRTSFVILWISWSKEISEYPFEKISLAVLFEYFLNYLGLIISAPIFYTVLLRLWSAFGCILRALKCAIFSVCCNSKRIFLCG